MDKSVGAFELVRLTVEHCPQHGIRSIMRGTGRGGEKLIERKCCGNWDTDLLGWMLTKAQCRQLGERLLRLSDPVTK